MGKITRTRETFFDLNYDSLFHAKKFVLHWLEYSTVTILIIQIEYGVTLLRVCEDSTGYPFTVSFYLFRSHKAYLNLFVYFVIDRYYTYLNTI